MDAFSSLLHFPTGVPPPPNHIFALKSLSQGHFYENPN